MERSDVVRLLGSLGRRKLLSFSLVLFTLATGIVIGTLISTGVDAARKDAVAPDAKPLRIPDPVPLENQFSPIAKQVRPSVVNIRVKAFAKRAERQSPREREGMEDFFRRFFGGPEGALPGQPFPPERRRRPGAGEGSGVIVDRNGYIITNNHVVEGADRIQVRLFNGSDDPYDAKLIGRDPLTDLAVIKINPKKRLSAASMGNSDAVNVGDWAIAIGSPLGYPETVTVGIISAKSRDVRGVRSMPFQKFIQTDAAINPGNSGGPLLNMRGEVIGINTAIATHTGGYQGLGFALASNIAVDVYNQIIQRGRVARGSIGIKFQANQKPALLRSFGAADGGVLVESVQEGGPAEKAGMLAEDVIVEIDGKPVADGDALIAVVAATPVDSTVPIVVIRDDQRKTLRVTIADREELFPDELGLGRGRPREEEESAEVLFGITVQNLTSADRQQWGYKGSGGVLVTEVEPGSFADDIGVLRNDIIVAINRRPVNNTADISELQEGIKPGDDVAVKVMRRTPGRGEPSWEAHYLADVLPQSSEERF